MAEPRLKSFNYAVGMFGTSIPINMLKTYAAIFYVDRLGMTTPQLALILFIYTFIDALDPTGLAPAGVAGGHGWSSAHRCWCWA
jgi:hypothetical protein